MASKEKTVAQWDRMTLEFELALSDQNRVIAQGNNTPYNQGWKQGFAHGFELSRRNLHTALEQTPLHRLISPVPTARVFRTLLISTLEALIQDHKENPRSYVSTDPEAFNEGLLEGLHEWVDSFKDTGHADKALVRKLRRK